METKEREDVELKIMKDELVLEDENANIKKDNEEKYENQELTDKTLKCFNEQPQIKEYEIKGIKFSFISIDIFTYTWYLRWLSNKLPEIKTESQYSLEMSLRGLALSLNSLGEEFIGRLPEGKTLFDIWKKYEIEKSDREEAGEAFYNFFEDYMDNKFSAIESMNDFISGIILDKYYKFHSDFYELDLDEKLIRDGLKDLTPLKIAYSPSLPVDLNINNAFRVTFTTMDNKIKRIAETMTLLGREGIENLSNNEYENIRSLCYLACSIEEINGRKIGDIDPSIFIKEKINLTEEQLLEHSLTKLDDLMKMPYSILGLLDSARGVFAEVLYNILYDDEGDLGN